MQTNQAHAHTWTHTHTPVTLYKFTHLVSRCTADGLLYKLRYCQFCTPYIEKLQSTKIRWKIEQTMFYTCDELPNVGAELHTDADKKNKTKKKRNIV